MISWLCGDVVDEWKEGSKTGIVVSCGGVGYQVQLIPRQLKNFNISLEAILWIHEIKREDGNFLYGFTTKNDRELFRKLISVKGIGPNIGLLLQDKFEIEELVSLIINKNINLLQSANGVGQKMAERLTVELKDKLNDFIHINENEQNSPLGRGHSSISTPCPWQELEGTLISIGYEKSDVIQALEALKEENLKESSVIKPNKTTLSSDESGFNNLLKASILWLSKNIS